MTSNHEPTQLSKPPSPKNSDSKEWLDEYKAVQSDIEKYLRECEQRKTGRP